MRKYILFLSLAAPVLGFSQWSKTQLKPQQRVNAGYTGIATPELYALDMAKLQQALEKAPEKTSGKAGAVVLMPNKQGKLEKFEIWEYSNMAPELQAKFTNIRAYVGRSTETPGSYLRFSVSPQGFSSMVIRSGASEYIEPYSADAKTYILYDTESKSHKQDSENFICHTEEAPDVVSHNGVSSKLSGSNTFRLALSCTGEYSQYHLTKAGVPSTATDEEKKAVVLAALNASVTRLNGVYEKDLSLHYNLIPETESLIFLDANTDPYSTGGGPDTANSGINATLAPNAATKYDLGHLVDKKAANGAAYVGVICGSSLKAGGWTAHNIPETATFDIDYVAHEMGHQMGAGHTYTFTTTQQDQKVEPGSGSTIMAYTGIVGALDVQYNSHDNYHYSSLNQIRNKINQVSCGTNVPFELPAPIVEAGNNYTIPKSTPFVVTATTPDADTESYTYSIEQIDQAAAAQMGTLSYTYETKPSGPNYRALPPVSEPYRYFPNFNVILSGVNTTRWESLSSVTRTLTFGVTLRNNNPLEPNIARDYMAVNVTADAGPFKVTAPAFGQSLTSESTFTVTWDVASTNQTPVNTSDVNIKLSKDGGQTFTTLVANTPNDGSETITLPAGSTSPNAFIMVEAVGNIYFAVSPSFVIDYTTDGESCKTYSYTGAPVAITDGLGGSGISSPKVESVLTVPDEGVITSIKVTPAITHGNVFQLSFGIESPVGSSALLMHHQCNARSGITATFTDEGTNINCTASPIAGTIKAYESLAIFKGHNTKGDWKIYASDNQPNTVGTITGWDLELCTRDQEPIVMGVKDSGLADNIKLYPNPSNGNFFVKTKELTGKVELSIYDTSGKRVYVSSDYQNAGQITKEYNVNLPKGVYIVNVKSERGTYSQKLIIK